MPRRLLPVLVALVLASIALLAVGGSLSGPVHWTPDGLFYQARSLELRGTDRADAQRSVFAGAPGAELRRTDPERSGDPAWVAYNAQFYERRVAVPAAAAALDGVAGERAIVDVSVAGYLVAVLALFAFLLLRFRLAVAAAVTLATIFLPTLTHHAGLPLTDSWGVALETLALVSAVLVLERGRSWLVLWVLTLLLLSFTRDSAWIPVLGAAWLAFRSRTRLAALLLGTGIAASIPVALLFPMPIRDLLAEMLNGAQPVANPSWSFVIAHYPGALVDLLRDDGGWVRDGNWYSPAYLLIGLACLAALARGRAGGPSATLLKASAVAGALYVAVVPVFSALRLELVLVPMAAFGLALAAEQLAERVALPAGRLAPRPLTEPLAERSDGA
jgi:hypothetical protein